MFILITIRYTFVYSLMKKKMLIFDVAVGKEQFLVTFYSDLTL